ncbi:pentatricopeptide repeat-containing protein At2g13600-like [Cryptomeria japonica]|uniref:pentatricopeptide repeat-containing protein At2g13600-like n=1 Tax=Cryptomeria japonica TaxID=3369 RepID=UPI0027DA3883|nr:pentatricopeptide repeat-containing protein At2g13600-like [Cryptomeria japonica]
MSSMAHLRALCTEGCLKEAVHILLNPHSSPVDSSTYLHLLQVCIAQRALAVGKQIHSHINDRGLTFATNTVLQNTLINMYDKCGSLVDSRYVFNCMTEPNVFSWNVMIAAYRRHGFSQEALTLFSQMQQTAVQPDHFTFSSILPVCANMASLEHGLQIHGKVIRCGFHSDIIVMNTLIDMHAKCKRMQKARELFDKMPAPTVVSWNAVIAGYMQNGLIKTGVEIFKKMQLLGINLNSATFAIILPLCAKTGFLEQGMEIHRKIIESGFLSDGVVVTALIDMYIKCGRLQKADVLFDKMSQRNAFSWNAMIVGYAQNGFVEKAFKSFQQMLMAGVNPDSTNIASILPTCAKLGVLEHGTEIHQKVIESGFLSDVVVTALIDMYAKCGNIQKARKLFDKMHNSDVVSWNAIIAGYTHNGALDEAFRLFEEMPQRDVVSWTAIIAGYTQNDPVEKALEIFNQMQQAGVNPNVATFVSILSACARIGALEQGMEIHQKIIENGFLSDVVLNSLIDMYAKCGSMPRAHVLFDKMLDADVISWTAMITGYAQSGVLDKALRLFKEMPKRNVVSWTAMIAGCAQNGLFDKAILLFKQMQIAGIRPDSATLASILPACAKLGALERGMEIHQKIVEKGFLSDVVLNALIDMYAKCGILQKALELFNYMRQPNVTACNIIIAGYATHGYGKEALKLFELMKHLGTNPNHVSFICVLFACSHTGLVVDGCKYFNSMTDSYCIIPTMDHYVCMVDLLARAGYLEEAFNFIIKMPINPDVVVWMCLLGSCRSHTNIWLGEFVARLIFELRPKDASPYVLLSNIYAEAGRWGDAKKARKLMTDRGIKKIPGCSWM